MCIRLNPPSPEFNLPPNLLLTGIRRSLWCESPDSLWDAAGAWLWSGPIPGPRAGLAWAVPVHSCVLSAVISQRAREEK